MRMLLKKQKLKAANQFKDFNTLAIPIATYNFNKNKLISVQH